MLILNEIVGNGIGFRRRIIRHEDCLRNPNFNLTSIFINTMML